MKQILTILVMLLTFNSAYAIDNTYMSPEYYRHFGKQQIKTKDIKGNTTFVTPHYKSYTDRNEVASEKVVAVYDKRSPAYGYRYVIYTPIKRYVGYRRVMQPSLNGYGYDPIPDGGEGSSTPCFPTIKDALHYYYPQWY